MRASEDVSTDVAAALNGAWDQDAAKKSLERWRGVCRQERWGEIPKNLALLIGDFGASWYFTRFVFFHGERVARLFDRTPTEDFSWRTVTRRLEQAIRASREYAPLDALRIAEKRDHACHPAG